MITREFIPGHSYTTRDGHIHGRTWTFTFVRRSEEFLWFADAGGQEKKTPRHVGETLTFSDDHVHHFKDVPIEYCAPVRGVGVRLSAMDHTRLTF